jgi:hypothetical protein
MARVEQRRAGANSPEVELDPGAECDRRELVGAAADAGLVERERDDYEDTCH